MSNKITLPSVFAMTGSLSISNGLMFGVDKENNEIPVEVIEKTLRGTISNANQKETEIVKTNIQTVDAANLPFGTSTLRLKFGVKIVPNILKPSSCNVFEYRNELHNFVEAFIANDGMEELSKRYTEQLLSADYLYRNKDSLSLKVTIEAKDRDGEFTVVKKNNEEASEFDRLKSAIKKSLSEKGSVLFLNVIVDAELNEMAEVFPSQDFSDSNKSRVLFHINNKISIGDKEREIRQAAMHSQKLGNALRRIDSWYKEEAYPIAVEPYGLDQEIGIAYRTPKSKLDLYSYLVNLPTLTEEIFTDGIKDHHLFVSACLIRGGVFGAKG